MLAVPFTGAAVALGALVCGMFLFPGLCVADGLRVFGGVRRWCTVLPGCVMCALLVLPWHLSARDGFSWPAFGFALGVAIPLFLVYWGIG
ncbi:MAG TPA: hypothetical protein PKM88_13235 [bacterium]|nr:hypothetical protein [bacterium]